MYHTDRTPVPEPTQRLTPKTNNKVSSPLFFDLNKDLFKGVGELYSKFIESELIMKVPNQLQLQTYKSNCKNLTTVDGYIEYYQQYTRNTVENILKLSSLIVEMKEKEKSGELDQTDMKYFCFSVGLKRDGSTFRKFEQIGKHSQTFWKYVDKLPDSYTVLYEITTLDPDKFEELMKDDEIHSYVTLRDVKRLGNKITKQKQNKDDYSFEVVFDPNLIPEEQLKKIVVVIKCLYQMSQSNIIEFNYPESQNSYFGISNRWNSETKSFIKDEERKIVQPVTEKEMMLLE